MKSVTKHYTQHHSPVYTCFWMNQKIKLNHFKLFRKLLERKTPIVLLKMLIYIWYSKQTVCIKWGGCISDFFSISNGVTQGRILSLKLFSALIYVDDFFDKLV